MPARPPMDAPVAPLRGALLFSLPRRDYGPESDPCSNLWPLGDTFRISQVNGRSFYWRASKAHSGRRLLVEWPQWLSELQRTRHLWWLDPEPAPRGWHLLRSLEPAPMAMSTPLQALDRFERDQRFRRAVQQVAQRYQLERSDDDQGAVRITVTGGSRPYTVQLRPDGVEPPACTCPDAIHRVELHGGFCKHVVAALLRWPDLRHQLLAAIL